MPTPRSGARWRVAWRHAMPAWMPRASWPVARASIACCCACCPNGSSRVVASCARAALHEDRGDASISARLAWTPPRAIEMNPLELWPVVGLGEIVPGSDLAAAISAAVEASGDRLVDGDIVVITQ